MKISHHYLATLCCLALLAPSSVQAQEGTTSPVAMVERSDDELALVSFSINGEQLIDGVPGYATQNSLLLPLRQVAEILDLGIKVSPQEGQAEGWIFEEANNFSLDVSRREATIGGTRTSFSASQVELHKDDIYVDSALLTEWLQVDFNFSFASQSVTLSPRPGVKLPIQVKTEREQARQLIGKTDGRAPAGPFERVEVPYKLYTIPYTDLTYTGGYDKRAYSGLHNSVSALADGDLLYMHSSIYVAGDDEEPLSDLRWTLSRRDPDGKILQSDDKLAGTQFGEMLHDYQIREVEFGDISTQQLPLTAFNQQGRGFMISNIPYDRATQYDRTSIQGDLQAGWEVELYRNDELLAFQRASANGRYEFIDVPLLSGLNIVRLVFYGPFGQKREETQRFLVSANLTQQGKSYFRTSISQQNEKSLEVLNQTQITGLSSATPDQLAAVKGETRAMFEYEYGLLDRLSLFAHAAHLTTGDGLSHNYVGTGLGTNIYGTYARVDMAHDASEGGNAMKLQLQDNIAGVSLSAEHQQYFDFISEFTETVDDPVTRRSTMRADTPLQIPFLPRLNHGVSGTQTLYESDRKVNELSYRISSFIRRLALSNNLTYRTDTSPTTTTLIGIGGIPVTIRNRDKQTTGEFIMSFPYRRLLLRSNMLYTVAPEKELQTLVTAAEYNISNDTNTIFQVDRQFIGEKLTNVTLALNHSFEKFRLGANVSRDSDGENRAGVTLSLSFGEDPRTGAFKVYPDYSANNGLISARAFQDVNGNKIFDEGDRPLEDARMLVNRGGNAQLTDGNGTILLRNISPDTRTSLTLDSRTVENPYLLSENTGVDVVTRPGVAALIDFPISGSGDIEGTVRIFGLDTDEKDASKVMVQLFTADGKWLRDTQTSFDGYYLFNGVPAGQYIIRVSAEQAARLQFITPPDRVVTITNDESDSHILDMEIIRAPESASSETSATTSDTAS